MQRAPARRPCSVLNEQLKLEVAPSRHSLVVELLGLNVFEVVYH
jgi:hypothetical protein